MAKSGHMQEREVQNTVNTNIMSLDGMVFGMPPGTHMSDKIMFNSMPTATITPCEANFSEGLGLFKLSQSEGMTEYRKILNTVGFNISGTSISVAYLADGFPTDTFTNEYGETFLDKFAQVASSGIGDMAQIMGWTTFGEAKTDVKSVADQVGAGGALDATLDTASKMLGGATSGLSQNNQGRLNGAINSMKSLVTGGRIDFPLVWKNSSFNPSYSMTIRLYNPDPGNAETTRKYIVGPIAALVALGVPKVGEDTTTYKWPLLCKVRSPGLYHLNAAYINSIAIVKGGDQQSIAFNQTMAMCDVRIEFGSLYNSILAGPGTNELGIDRPTLGTYLESIGGSSVTAEARKRDCYSMKTNENNLELIQKSTAVSHSAPISSTEEKDYSSLPKARINTDDRDIENELKSKSGFPKTIAV